MAVVTAGCGGSHGLSDTESRQPESLAASPAASALTPALAVSPTSTLPWLDGPTRATPKMLVGEPKQTATSAPAPPPTVTATPFMEIQDRAQALAAERFALLGGWATNFRKRSVDLNEVETLLARDRIPPIDAPDFSLVSKPPGYMRQEEPVIAVRVGTEAKAYPLAILMWHEIVNDVIGGRPVSVTFCPLCNSAIVFDRTVRGVTLTFGTSGALRHSDLVMWDRETQTWWQQITGEAIAGDLTGTKLNVLPSSITSWKAFADANPSGKVLRRAEQRDGTPLRPYDEPPYAGYDDVNVPPFAFRGDSDKRLPATARVLTVESGGDHVAYPFDFLKAQLVANDSVGGHDIVVVYDGGVRSAFLDAGGRQQVSGGAVAFSRSTAGRTLTFEVDGEGMRDTETRSVWTRSGAAVSGPLAGANLETALHGNHFWFAWAVFKPGTQIRKSVADLRP